MTKIKNITTDDLGYNGLIIPAGATIDVPAIQAKRMAEDMPDRFRLARKAPNRSMANKKTENRAVE